jgi:hypothetical protein
MKILSVIFSIHILFLTIAPALPLVFNAVKGESCKSSCCTEHKQQKQNHSQDNNCCNNGICNPFMSCCNGYALLTHQKGLSPYFAYLNQKFQVLSETLNTGFSSDAWHPPKIV